MKSGIYQIKNLVNKKIYIGSAVDLKSRWRVHKHKLNHNKHNNKHLQNAWNKYGSDKFEFKIIEESQKEELIKLEQHYMDTILPEYNICKIAGNTLGVKNSEETRKKMSESHKGVKLSSEHILAQRLGRQGICRPMLGKNHSEETKIKMSESHKGKHKGIKITDEVKIKMSNGTATKLSEEKVREIKQMINDKTSPKDIAKMFNISQSMISRIKNGSVWKHIT